MLALMQRYPGKLFQIGQKKGGIDAGAMAGIPTLYIKDIGSGTKTRIQRWVGMVQYYECVRVNELATLLRRALRATDAELRRLDIVKPPVLQRKETKVSSVFLCNGLQQSSEGSRGRHHGSGEYDQIA